MSEISSSSLADTACLLLHGLERPASDFAELAAQLTAQGALTESLVLPGDGLSARQARRFGWPEWVKVTLERYHALAAQRERVMLVGHSLGGVLALYLAAHEPGIAGVVTLCAPVRVSRGFTRLTGILRVLLPYYYKSTEDNGDPETRKLYQPHWVAIAPLHALLVALPTVVATLPEIHCPALIVAARHDHVVPFTDGQLLYDRIGSPQKTLVLLERSQHLVLRDVEREYARQRILDFINAR